MKTDSEIIHETLLADPKTTIRTTKEVAKQILLDNRSMTVGGEVRYFMARDLGIGVYEVGLRGVGKKGSYFFKNAEWHKERKLVTAT